MPHRKGASHPRWKGGIRIKRGYRMLRCPGHPRADRSYVYEHILVVEMAMQKELAWPAEVHHVNEDIADNANPNLVACQDVGYHKLLHMRQRALDACGHADWRKCRFCPRYDAPANMIVNSAGRQSPDYCHHECRLSHQRAMRAAA
jgi:hypothetical protein